MGEKNISLNIASRIYPISVNDELEEAEFEKAANLVNEKINEYASLYAFKDTQDLLSMVALQFAINIIKNSKEVALNNEDINSKIEAITEMVDNYLKTERSLNKK